MSLLDTFLEQGYTPQGMPRKTINTDTGQIGYEPDSTIGKIAKGLQTFLLQRQQQQEKLQKEMDKKIDMYKTLREAGYDSKSAHDAVIAGKFPSKPGGVGLEEQKKTADIEKSKATTEYYKSRTPLTAEEAQKKIELINAQIEKLKTIPPVDELAKQKTEKQIELLNAQIEKIKTKTIGPETQKSESQKFREAIQQVREGKIDWEDLEQDYPDRISTIQKIKKQTTLVGRSPAFREGQGPEAFFKKNVAKMTPKAKNMISQIKTQADLDEFMEDVDKMIANGKFSDNDRRTVLEYFGIE